MQKRIYNFEKIRGVDVTSSPINVASNRASRMVNMINEGGVNKKRHGWRDIAWFKDSEGNKEPINGIFKYTTALGAEETIVHAGTHLYRCDGSFEKSPAYAEIGVAENKKSKGYFQDGKLWIVCGGEYLVYDGDKIQPVMNSEYAYVPTTSIGIKPGNEYSGERFQGVNLFQKRRKNKFIGQNEQAKYLFDAPIKDIVSIVIEYYRTVGDEQEYTKIVADYTEEGLTVVATDKEGNRVDGVANEFENDVQILLYSPQRSGLEVFAPYPPIVEGESNITVEFIPDYETTVELSASNTVSMAAGVNSLCLVNHGNIVYFSDILYGYGYFPDNDYIGVGTEDKVVTAMVTLDNGRIGVFKEDELYQVNIGVNYIDEEYVVRIEPAIVAVSYGPGCQNEHCALQVNGDSLIYNSMGVHGLTGSQEKPVNMRSTNVNRELCGYSRSYRGDAFAVSHEGRYYLFIDGCVYIADTRFKTYESNRLDAGYEYEWWIWQGCPCRCAYSFDGKLIMGTDSGEIREFTDGYKDERLTKISSATGDMVYDGVSFTFNEALKLEDGSQIQIQNAFEKINVTVDFEKTEFEEADELIRFCYKDDNKIPNVYLGMEIILFKDRARMYGRVVDCDYASCEIVVKRDIGDKYDATLKYELLKAPGTYLVQKKEGKTQLLNSDGQEAVFVDYDEINGVILRSDNVYCEMVTGVIDFYKLHSKTLYKLAITPSEDTQGEIQIGYETNLGRSDKSRFVGEAFSFDTFDFKSFVFDGAFAKTFVKRTFERNFNYITFRVASNSDGPFGIENAQAVYSINNELRSDR